MDVAGTGLPWKASACREAPGDPGSRRAPRTRPSPASPAGACQAFAQCLQWLRQVIASTPSGLAAVNRVFLRHGLASTEQTRACHKFAVRAWQLRRCGVTLKPQTLADF